MLDIRQQDIPGHLDISKTVLDKYKEQYNEDSFSEKLIVCEAAHRKPNKQNRWTPMIKLTRSTTAKYPEA